MASGCPLVVSDIPSHREFLDESTSVFVDPCRSAAIALGIETCLVDPQSAKDRSARARGAVAQWSVGRMVTAYEELYHDLIRADRELRGAGS
jgi:glycosyltransferase involved in cell wall biosynthesis